MGLRDRRENRRRERSEFGAGGSAATYQLRARLVSFGDDYWIENADGDRVLRVDGKVLRVRKTLDIEDTQGKQLCRIQTRVLHIRDTMVIERPDGAEMAKVHKALITPLRERWKVDVAGRHPDGGPGQHPRSRVRPRRRRPQDRRGFEEVVPGPGHLRRADRAGRRTPSSSWLLRWRSTSWVTPASEVGGPDPVVCRPLG